MSSIALQLQLLSPGSVGAGSNVQFDSVIYSDGDVIYNPVTGEITLNAPGRFLINWWVSTQAASTPSGAEFTLNTSLGGAFRSASPNRMGQISGSAIVTIAAAPVTVALSNSGTVPFYYAATSPVRAGFTIFQEANPGPEADALSCFGIAQMANILRQVVLLYPTTTMTVYTTNLNAITGTPYEVYESPDATDGGVFIILDSLGQYNIIPLVAIVGFYTGNGTVYDPSITYLTPPSPLPPGCSTNLFTAVVDLLPIGTEVILQAGVTVQASGNIYQNELGILVLSDDLGSTPIFMATQRLARIVAASIPDRKSVV